MARRTYDQYCPIARALDVVGERWSLLIVRELLTGPKRYTDLRGALPGMWTNLLAERLRQLEEAGIVQRVELPPPAARTVYELTRRGRELEPALLQLGQWGTSLLPGGPIRESVPLSTVVLLGIRASFQPEAAASIHETYGFTIGDTQLRAEVNHGELDLRPGAADRPAAAMHADAFTLLDIRLGRADVDTAIDGRLLRFEGPAPGIRRLRRTFAL